MSSTIGGGNLIDIVAPDVGDHNDPGTDAVRDGVDVPGRALRLIAFDRVPWPRPDILHQRPPCGRGAETASILIPSVLTYSKCTILPPIS